ncbi:MAG: hypothetical protein GWN62_36960, partial [Aliifodinibius sp.]|nr:hypothetical protein [Fodinibius sp.]
MKVFQYLLILIFASTLTIEAIPTKLVVRAKASDAKFIGSSMGGALVIIRDSETSQILAKGFTSGTTGNTQKIMRAPVERYKRITDEPTAKFEAVIEINEPTLISIEVLSPYAQK